MISEILLVFVLAVAAMLILWCLLGLLLMPVFSHNMITCCFAKDDGEKLEQQIRAFGWLRDGKLSGGRFVIVDCGLNPEGVQIAKRLCKDHNWITYCHREKMTECLDRMEDTV